jgi:hypothetical protein
MKYSLVFIKIVGIISLLIFCLCSCTSESNDGSYIEDGVLKVPIEVKQAENIGSLMIQLSYDSDVMSALEVKSSQLTTNSMIEYNTKVPGLVLIGIVDTEGVNGDGAIAEISFDIIQNTGTTLILIDQLEAYDVETLIDVQFVTNHGLYSFEDDTLVIPTIEALR